MVVRRRLIDQFMSNLAARGEILHDIHNGCSLDRAAFTKRLDATFDFFTAVGFSRGDKVILLLENSIDYVVILLALLDLDVVIVPLNPRLNKDQLLYLAGHCQAQAVITSQALQERGGWVRELDCKVILTNEISKTAEIVRKCVPDGSKALARSGGGDVGLKFILYTSGTAGSPKGVMISGKAVRHKIQELIKLLKFRKHSAFFSFLPYFSGHGMVPGMLVPFLSGCTIYVASFDPFFAFRFRGLVKEHRINSFTSVPSVLALLKEHLGSDRGADLRTLQTIYCASSPLSQDIYDWFSEELGLCIRNCYGLTEAFSWVSVNTKAGRKDKASCVGWILGGNIKVFDHKGKRLGPDEPGELCIKTPWNMMGYFKDAAATRSVSLRGGYLRTGDIVRVDPRGRIFILDRIKHIMIRNGINVYPLEIDQVFQRHPKVREAVSFGVPDEHHGEKIITALVVRDAAPSWDQYMKYAMDNLSPVQVPNEIFFPGAIPKGVTGKILIEDLKAGYLKERS